jgi:hypothetical protein
MIENASRCGVLTGVWRVTVAVAERLWPWGVVMEEQEAEAEAEEQEEGHNCYYAEDAAVDPLVRSHPPHIHRNRCLQP